MCWTRRTSPRMCLVTPHNDCVKIDWLDDYFEPPTPPPTTVTLQPHLMNQFHGTDHFPKHWPNFPIFCLCLCFMSKDILMLFHRRRHHTVDALSKTNLNIDFISSYTQFYSSMLLLLYFRCSSLTPSSIILRCESSTNMNVMLAHTHTRTNDIVAQVLYWIYVKIGKMLGRNNCRKYCWPNNTPNVILSEWER